MDLGSLKIGCDVDIQRTDGRIHSAVVSKIQKETQSITVEWFENGETKGKEIDLVSIFQLNPELRCKNYDEKSKSTSVEEVMSVDEEIENDDLENDETLNPKNHIPKGVKKQFKEPLQQIERPLMVPNNHLKTSSKSVSVKQITKTQSSNISNVKELPPNLGKKRVTTTNLALGPNTRHPSRQLSLSQLPGMTTNNVNNESRTLQSTSNNSLSTVAPVKKKMNCMKELEKIKQLREERRATQAAIREHMEKTYNGSMTPNWDFEAMIKEYRGKINYRPMNFCEPVTNHRICVCVRKRPINAKELFQKEIDVVTVLSKDVVLIHEPKTKVDLTRYLDNHRFRFDYVFDESADNEMVYRYTAQPLVECIFDRGMATCFAYGQTGSGKTHTMGGEFTKKGIQNICKGIYGLAAHDVFALLSGRYKHLTLVVFASFFEIYSGKVFDLLNHKSKLRVLEDHKQQVQVCGLKEEAVTSVDDILRLVQKGSQERTSGVTSANSQSSRSHAIFQIILKKRDSKQIYGKFSLIDLAGSERGADTRSCERQTRLEGAEINKSLLALKECIRAMSAGGAHLPFRVSQLTQVLKDSFTGENSKTCMIAMISPGMNCCEHSINTLRYADRVKELGPSDSQNEEEISGLPKKSLKNDRLQRNYCLNNGESGDAYGNDGEYENDDEDEYEDDEDEEDYDDDKEEITEEMKQFQQAVDVMQEQEEHMLDSYVQLNEEMEKWVDMNKKMLKMTEAPGYDMEKFCTQLEDLLSQKIVKINSFKEIVTSFKEMLKYEESLSKNLTNNSKKN